MLPRMKKTTIALFVSALMLPFLSGCGEAKASTAGKYQIDKAEMEKTMLAAMPAEQRESPEAKAALKPMMDAMVGTIELKADNTCSMTLKIPPILNIEETGTWKLEGSTLSITGKDENGKEQTKSAKLEGGKITLEEEKGGQKMTMTFAREEKK